MRPNTHLPARLLLLAVCFAVTLPSPARAEAPRPNIRFLMADDQAPWAMHCAGDPHAFTPNMDRLAKGGARFTNAFTPTPV